MDQPGIEQRPLRMINGVTTEFGQVLFDGARVAAANMIGEPGEGWRLAMTIVSHEREPGELGYVARYAKTVKEMEHTVARRSERLPQRSAPAGRVGPRAGPRCCGCTSVVDCPSGWTASSTGPEGSDRQAPDDVGRAERRHRGTRRLGFALRCSTPTTWPSRPISTVGPRA